MMNVVVPTDGLEAIPQSYLELLTLRAIYSADTHDDHWLGLGSVSPRDAAYLLCGLDPIEVPKLHPEPNVPAIVLVKADNVRVNLLEARLRDRTKVPPARRSWREWHAVAREIEADYHKGFDYFFDEVMRPSKGMAAVASATEVFRANNGATAATSASDAKEKKWTQERLAELAAYRETHTMSETAKKFGISQQRIRQLLPRSEPKLKGYSAFTHRTK